MAKRANAKTIEVNSSHVAYISHAKETAKLIEEAAASVPLRGRLEAYLSAEGIELGPGSRIRLLTLPRILGYVFNPISIYFCFERAEDPRLGEVSLRHGRQARSKTSRAMNTPWRANTAGVCASV